MKIIVAALVAGALAAGAAVATVHPLPAYGAVVAGTWLAVATALLFPGLRRWVPFAATLGVLAVGGWMVWREVPYMVVGYGGFAAASLGVGVALKRMEFQGAGMASGGLLGALKYESWIPTSGGGWGVMLLAAGFLFLTAGVVVNLLLVRRRPPATPEPG